MSNSEKRSGMHIGNIGSVQGDIVGGNKVTANNSAVTGGDGEAKQETPDTPVRVQVIVAITGLVAAIAAAAGVAIQLLK